MTTTPRHQIRIAPGPVACLSHLARQSPEALYERVRAVNDEQQLTRAAFALNDVRITVESAAKLPVIAAY